jgi:hypothetical protein
MGVFKAGIARSLQESEIIESIPTNKEIKK